MYSHLCTPSRLVTPVLHIHGHTSTWYVFGLCISKEGQSGGSRTGRGKKSRRTLSRKSARPHQIFTQEQLYCRNITHRRRSVIRSIFSAPLPLSVSLLLWESTPLHLSSAHSPPLASPGCWNASWLGTHASGSQSAIHVHRTPLGIKWLPDRLLLLKCRQRYASAGRACCACALFFCGGYLYASASVCGLETCTAVIQKKKERRRKKERKKRGGKATFPNYVANLTHTVCVCACVFCNLVGTEWVSCQKWRGWVRESVCVCFSDSEIQASNTLGRGETSQALRNFLAEPDFCCHYP